MRLSYSSINTYETCPAKWRFQYEERLPQGTSPFLSFGDSIHRALYRFHDRPVPVPPSLGDLWGFLQEEWVEEGYADEAEARLYFEHARQVLSDYHAENAGDFRIPAALEYRFSIDVEGVTLTGVIDRMDRLPGGGYEIIDYKTNRRLPPKQRLQRDLQLSVYALAAREVWGIEPEKLTLYFLLPRQRMTTFRGTEDIDALRRRVATVAERVEAGMFEPRENPLCNWCEFKPQCPLYRHAYEQAEAPRITEVVDEWVTLKVEERERARRLEELGATIRAYAEEHGHQQLFGTDGAVRIVERVETALEPGRVRELLEPLGLWEQVSTVDAGKLAELIESRTLPPAVEDALLAGREEIRRVKALHLREGAKTRR